jgi:hypothetical protein
MCSCPYPSLLLGAILSAPVLPTALSLQLLPAADPAGSDAGHEEGPPRSRGEYRNGPKRALKRAHRAVLRGAAEPCDRHLWRCTPESAARPALSQGHITPTPTTARPRSQQWRRLCDMNAGACVATGTLCRSPTAPDRHRGFAPWSSGAPPACAIPSNNRHSSPPEHADGFLDTAGPAPEPASASRSLASSLS